MLPTITLRPFHHRGAEQVGLFFAPHATLQDAVRRIKDARWSRTHDSWYLPLTESHYKLLVQGVGEKASLNEAALKTYLEQLKALYHPMHLPPTLSKTQSDIVGLGKLTLTFNRIHAL